MKVGIERARRINAENVCAIAKRVGINVVRSLVSGNYEDAVGRVAITTNSDGGIVAKIGAVINDRI